MEPTVLKISRNGLNCNEEDIIKERFPGDGMESVLPKIIPTFSQNEFSATAGNLKKFKALQNFHKSDSCDNSLTYLPNSLTNEDITNMPFQIQNEGLLERLNAKVQFLQEHNEKLIEEKLKISHQLASQTQVNNELKNLLIASIGDDLEAKHEQMILDRIQRDLELQKLRIILEENQEEVQQAQIQVDVWRSKFLASRVMNEELVQWKSALYYKYRDSHTALQNLLEEHSKIRALNSATRKGLVKIAELLNCKDVSLDSEIGLTLVNTAFLNHDLVESLIEILEESSLLEKALLEIKENIPLKCIFKKNLVKETFVKPSELSTAEQLAHEIVMNNGIQTEELVRMRRDYLAHNRISHFLSTNYHVTFNCCNSCRGHLIHL